MEHDDVLFRIVAHRAVWAGAPFSVPRSFPTHTAQIARPNPEPGDQRSPHLKIVLLLVVCRTMRNKSYITYLYIYIYIYIFD